MQRKSVNNKIPHTDTKAPSKGFGNLSPIRGTNIEDDDLFQKRTNEFLNNQPITGSTGLPLNQNTNAFPLGTKLTNHNNSIHFRDQSNIFDNSQVVRNKDNPDCLKRCDYALYDAFHNSVGKLNWCFIIVIIYATLSTCFLIIGSIHILLSHSTTKIESLSNTRFESLTNTTQSTLTLMPTNSTASLSTNNTASESSNIPNSNSSNTTMVNMNCPICEPAVECKTCPECSDHQNDTTCEICHTCETCQICPICTVYHEVDSNTTDNVDATSS